ncbi:hypothetical protein DNTS_009891 [Danionella cerebrum]|uniref:Uncharacterized protein n=1 Tax=Danionella cerebrum TaxID=2873325 RepID=A0A553NIZ6_9TELE|nr:hypothetical protein DNTS_009891 [Danionella translucida]
MKGTLCISSDFEIRLSSSSDESSSLGTTQTSSSIISSSESEQWQTDIEFSHFIREQRRVSEHRISVNGFKTLRAGCLVSLFHFSTLIHAPPPFSCRIFVVGIGFFSLCFLMTSLGGQFSAKRLADSPFSIRTEVVGTLESRGVLKKISDTLEIIMKRIDTLSKLSNNSDSQRLEELSSALNSFATSHLSSNCEVRWQYMFAWRSEHGKRAEKKGLDAKQSGNCTNLNKLKETAVQNVKNQVACLSQLTVPQPPFQSPSILARSLHGEITGDDIPGDCKRKTEEKGSVISLPTSRLPDPRTLTSILGAPSSYRSARSSAGRASSWTIQKLRHELVRINIQPSRKAKKAELLRLYQSHTSASSLETQNSNSQRATRQPPAKKRRMANNTTAPPSLEVPLERPVIGETASFQPAPGRFPHSSSAQWPALLAFPIPNQPFGPSLSNPAPLSNPFPPQAGMSGEPPAQS